METSRDEMSGDDACVQDALQVYYDGGCPLCQREIAHYRKIDREGRVDFVDLTKEDAATGPDLNTKDALARFHVRDGDGKLMSGAEAFVRLWQELPGWRWLVPLARIPGVIWIMERAYRAFLPLRPRVQQWVAPKR